jgi:hypothetical protein
LREGEEKPDAERAVLRDWIFETCDAPQQDQRIGWGKRSEPQRSRRIFPAEMLGFASFPPTYTRFFLAIIPQRSFQKMGFT